MRGVLGLLDGAQHQAGRAENIVGRALGSKVVAVFKQVWIMVAERGLAHGHGGRAGRAVDGGSSRQGLHFKVVQVCLRHPGVLTHAGWLGDGVGAGRHGHDGAIQAVGRVQQLLTVGSVLVVGVAILVLVVFGTLALFATQTAVADNDQEDEEDQDAHRGTDQNVPLLIGDGDPGGVAAGVIKGQDHTPFHHSSVILSHAEVRAEVMLTGVGDGEVEPPLNAVKSDGLTSQVVGLVGKGCGMGVVVDDSAIHHPPVMMRQKKSELNKPVCASQ